MKHLYCISGLGADERIFSKIEWPEDICVHYLTWLPPLDQEESLQSYARRMSAAIAEPDPILMGASFGGIMSIEISKLIPVQKIVLVSSITSYRELPWWMRTCGRLKLDAVLPRKGNFRKKLPLQVFHPVQNFFLGAESDEAKMLAAEFRDKVDTAYLKWSIHHILNWKNEGIEVPFVQIHGSKDKLFPVSNVKPTHVVENTGHFMVFQRPAEVSRLLSSIL